MALGALDALQRHAADGHPSEGTVIVGADGTDEASATIRSGGTPFRATVVQDSQRVADLAVSLLVNLSAGDEVEVENLVPTTVYPTASVVPSVTARPGAPQDPTHR